MPSPANAAAARAVALSALKRPPGMNRNDLVSIHKLPGFRSLHESLMGDQFLRLFRGTMRFDVIRARDQFPVDRPDASCDQVRVLKIANPYRTIITLRDQINEAITVAGVDVELGMASRHVREHGSEVGRAERKRRRNSQAAAKFTGG
ncbi:hypothetical protein ABIA18_000794 [Sinorhizobium fredii]